ncbi:uncharacterized protein TNCV_4564771 [Trichonephila clavipes]|nr:uncharacterized protein TNCV_4564771 [Trichonephila clavipes]
MCNLLLEKKLKWKNNPNKPILSLFPLQCEIALKSNTSAIGVGPRNFKLFPVVETDTPFFKFSHHTNVKALSFDKFTPSSRIPNSALLYERVLNSNSVAQQPMRARVYWAHSSIRDHWALRCMSRCSDQVVRLTRDPQCLNLQESLVLVYRPTAVGMKGLVDLAQSRNRTGTCVGEARYATT